MFTFIRFWEFLRIKGRNIFRSLRIDNQSKISTEKHLENYTILTLENQTFLAILHS
jgi:hypothetical protein